MGNGGSLNTKTLERLEMDTFATNAISRIFPRTHWRPTYYVMAADSYKFGYWQHWFRDGIKAAQVAYVWNKYFKDGWLLGRDNVKWLEFDEHPKWSDDITVRVSKWATSLYSAAQIATALGYSPLYLTGCDGFKEPMEDKDVNHFDPEYAKGKHLDWKKANRDMKVAWRNAAKHCTIYDATEADGFGVFEKVTL